MSEEFKAWAIVEVMGHNEYAGFVSAETIAGTPMIRVDVPPVEKLDGFTKFLAPGSIYGISPCTEATARLRAASLKKTPFESWSVEKQVIQKLKDEGKLVENKQLRHESPGENDLDRGYSDYDPDDDDDTKDMDL